MHLPGGSETEEKSNVRNAESTGQPSAEGMVSLMAEVPEQLLLAMRAFIDRHPNWDQYRLFQAALAGFLVQHSAGNRAITRCYLANLFPGSGGFQDMHCMGEVRSQPFPLTQPLRVQGSPLNLNGSMAA
jgi:hypothetical protein